MRKLIVVATLILSLFCDTQLHAQNWKPAQDSLVRYIDNFLRMDPHFDLEYVKNLRDSNYQESFSRFMELDSTEWDPKKQYPELFTSYGDLISEDLMIEMGRMRLRKRFTQYSTVVNILYFEDHRYWNIHIDVYLN